MSEDQGKGREIRLVTEDGAFGRPAHMVIVRRWENAIEKAQQRRIKVDSFVVIEADAEKRLERIEEMKQDVIADPLFISFTVLEFVSETRLWEPEKSSKIIVPSQSDLRAFGKSPNGHG